MSVALEAYKQQGRSKFFQDVIDAVAASRRTMSVSEELGPREVATILRANGLVKLLMAAYRRHTGMNLSDVVIVKDSRVNAMMELDFTHSGQREARRDSITFAETLEKISALYDPKKSKARDHTKPEDLELGGMNLKLHLLSGLFMRKYDGTGWTFSDEEISAIIMHEFGHGDDFIRTLGRARRMCNDAADVIDFIKENPNRASLLRLAQTIDPRVFRYKEYRDLLKRIIADLSDTSREVTTADAEVVDCLIVVVKSGLCTEMFELYNYYWHSDSELLNVGSDVRATTTQTLDRERSADDFSSRHGAAEYLVSALITLTNNSRDARQHRLGSLGKVGAFINGLQTFFDKMNVLAEELEYVYDKPLRRIELIGETAKHAMSDPNLSPEEKSYYRKQIEQIEKYLAQYRSTDVFKSRMRIKQWFVSMGKITGFIRSPIANFTDRDYYRLQNATRALGRNELYYLADKHTA